ncbi:MAG: AAA family ATPase [Candidatus Eisenbacteria bacterium]
MVRRANILKRDLELSWTPNPVTGSAALFLWGPRQTGKTTLLHQKLPRATFYDLLDTRLRAALSVRPHDLREELLSTRPRIVVIDEIQEVPDLLQEVHWLLENTSMRFVLCGSSARKLRRKARNLLGGRATESHLFPLSSHEIPDLDLLRAFNHGTLPVHYLTPKPAPLLRAYVNAYIKEEIIDESATRNIPAFARFLHVVGLTHGQQLNYANIARETGVSAATVRSYYQILEDTLLGFTLEPWRRSKTRRLVETAKFYLFDIGIANYLHPEARTVTEGSDLYGRAFEHFMLNDVRAFLSYRRRERALSFWRTSSGFEVDLILGDLECALEFKSARRIRDGDLKGLRALMEEQTVGRSVVVSREERARRTEDGIEIFPWRRFCELLWKGEII